MSRFVHKPVMAQQCIEHLKLQPGKVIVDGTVGLGGHSGLILKEILPGGMLIGIDRDKHALGMAKEKLGTGFLPVHGNFFEIKDILQRCGIDEVDGILLDLGVSSYQLDDPRRGFTYMKDAELDMRMDDSQALCAKQVVNDYSEQRLYEIIRDYGEERWARRIAQFIVAQRQDKPIERTGELVEVIKAAIPKGARKDGPHPAKRTFQAIRIEVNQELDGLGQAIEDAVSVLKPGGRLCVITFHSLEDRIVKQTFQKLYNPCTCPKDSPVCTCGKVRSIEIITRKPIVSDAAELEENPRARSAKLRVAEKI